MKLDRWLLARAALMTTVPACAQAAGLADPPSPPAPTERSAPVLKRIPAGEAGQGVASDGTYVYAVDNTRIGKYRITDGVRVAGWTGDSTLFPHINSCTVAAARLVCAASNYPAVPQTSSVELFDLKTLRHLGTHSFGITEGSLTVLDFYRGNWWAVFAQYEGRGGEPGRDNRDTQLVKLDDSFRPLERWTFPHDVLEKMKPKSVSGASWSSDGALAISGHDLPEIYIVTLPAAGSVLQLKRVVPVATNGQAIDWEPSRQGQLWSISREDRALVLSKVAGE